MYTEKRKRVILTLKGSPPHVARITPLESHYDFKLKSMNLGFPGGQKKHTVSIKKDLKCMALHVNS